MNLFLLNTNRFTEIIESAAKQSASALQELINQPVNLSFSQVKIIKTAKDAEVLDTLIENPGVVVKLNYQGELIGTAILILWNGHEKKLAQSLIDEHIPTSDNEEALEVVFYEIGNVLLNIYVGTIANQLNAKVEYNIPQVIINQDKKVWAKELITREIPPQELLFLKSALSIGELEITAFIIILIDYSAEVADKLC